MTDEQYEPLEHCVEILKTVASDYRKALARIAELEAGLLRIGQPGKQIVYCRDGHEEAVLLARAAYLGEK